MINDMDAVINNRNMIEKLKEIMKMGCVLLFVKYSSLF